MKDDSIWKEHTNPTVLQEKEHTALEQEWKRKMEEKSLQLDVQKVEKD